MLYSATCIEFLNYFVCMVLSITSFMTSDFQSCICNIVKKVKVSEVGDVL